MVSRSQKGGMVHGVSTGMFVGVEGCVWNLGAGPFGGGISLRSSLSRRDEVEPLRELEFLFSRSSVEPWRECELLLRRMAFEFSFKLLCLLPWALLGFLWEGSPSESAARSIDYGDVK